ncbi:MAG: hypothetical protein KatS3mg109_1081 [Pirellulaceae bacterium]|nr:MAG: hypothetical protein KatS3mg109_1081 [Pirellulaceae bacterium]GIW93644.1 MAG: hypothetical protein KatS3mg110_1685 [Pirellulaceae bacterium]
MRRLEPYGVRGVPGPNGSSLPARGVFPTCIETVDFGVKIIGFPEKYCRLRGQINVHTILISSKVRQERSRYSGFLARAWLDRRIGIRRRWG